MSAPGVTRWQLVFIHKNGMRPNPSERDKQGALTTSPAILLVGPAILLVG